VLEENARTFVDNWTGTGTINNSGDTEVICLLSDQYMESEVVHIGTVEVELLQNVYRTLDTIKLRYRHGTTSGECLAASWVDYITSFDCLGYIQIRVESI